jgi:hypothetical protein
MQLNVMLNGHKSVQMQSAKKHLVSIRHLAFIRYDLGVSMFPQPRTHFEQ